jgi:hypothetical protein
VISHQINNERGELITGHALPVGEPAGSRGRDRLDQGTVTWLRVVLLMEPRRNQHLIDATQAACGE